MNYLIKNFIFVFLIFLIISAVFAMFTKPFEEEKKTSLTQLVEDINQEKIKQIVISGNNVTVTYHDDSQAKSKKEIESSLSQSLINYGVNQERFKSITIESEEEK